MFAVVEYVKRVEFRCLGIRELLDKGVGVPRSVKIDIFVTYLWYTQRWRRGARPPSRSCRDTGWPVFEFPCLLDVFRRRAEVDDGLYLVSMRKEITVARCCGVWAGGAIEEA